MLVTVMAPGTTLTFSLFPPEPIMDNPPQKICKYN